MAADTSSTTTSHRTYVLDTSVLLADPGALRRFEEHEVVVPVVVITELEGKRNHPELGYFARAALRSLDELRVQHGRLDEPVPVGEAGGTIRVELNHTDPTSLPSGFRLGDNDSRILAVAHNLAQEGHQVTLVSKDLPMRIKASAVGLDAQEYLAELAAESGWTGMAEVEVGAAELDELYDDGVVDIEEVRDLPCHTGPGAALGPRQRPRPGEGRQAGPPGARRPRRVRHPRPVRGAAGRPGAAARPRGGHRVPRRPRRHRQVGDGAVRRPRGRHGAPPAQEGRGLPAAVRRRRPGARLPPGNENEKMSPWGQAVFDTLGALTTPDVIDEVLDRGMLEVLPLTHIRGRSLHDAFVIVDEAQSLERNVLLTVLSRIGANSKVVLTHDVAQRDNLRVGRHDGVVAVVERLKGHPLFAHVTLHRSERSPIAALVTEMLESVVV